jgi:hypothetical protein
MKNFAIVILCLISYTFSYGQKYKVINLEGDKYLTQTWIITENTVIQGAVSPVPRLHIYAKPKFVIKRGAKLLLRNVLVDNRIEWAKLEPDTYFEWDSIYPGKMKGHMGIPQIDYNLANRPW